MGKVSELSVSLFRLKASCICVNLCLYCIGAGDIWCQYSISFSCLVPSCLIRILCYFFIVIFQRLN
ncbi:hypothetical protein PRUPE_8G094000 [Prunus persica]|uniref:Uncharacterized protein n=1 Tax=Prunus persica TaxID=3760 RepID=A0A251MVK9_PRUPE|nr:hypothetical protein PRUPE_8G094000 [Prunus persica]